MPITSALECLVWILDRIRFCMLVICEINFLLLLTIISIYLDSTKNYLII